MFRFYSQKKSARCACIYALLFMSAQVMADEEIEFSFDESLLLGQGYNTDILTRLAQGPDVLPGEYQVDLFINGRFYSREQLQFFALSDGSVEPCIEESLWLDAGVMSEHVQPAPVTGSCSLGYRVEGNSFSFDPGKLRLELSIPQAYMKRQPRGYVSPERWDAGETALFINYTANYYRSENRVSGGTSSDSGYVGLNSGFNLGLWRIRNQSTYQYRDYGYGAGYGSDSQFNSQRTYVSRARPSWEAELTLGELYTRSTVFGSIGFKGFQIQTDNRMLPVSQRGYAPVVTGIAQTTAKVVIKQNGREIYQTTVAAGPFEINDLYPTSYQGDLLVEVTEADGRVSSFTVPFSAVPGAMRAGQSQFALSMGKSYDTGDDDYFADFTYELGLSNALTWNAGVRLADDYLALSSGGVWSSNIGSFGATAVYSHSRLSREVGQDESEAGWRLGLNYSRAFDSGTSVTLAGYKYSTEGYRELSDVLRQREYLDSGYEYLSADYLQKTQMTLSMNQSMGEWGILSVSGSKRQYRNGREDDDQYQLGYSNQFGPVSVSLNYARQYLSMDRPQESFLQEERIKDDVWSLNLSMPLGASSHMVSTGASHSSSSGADDYNLGMSGTLDDARTLSYSINASRQENDSYSGNSFGASVHKRTSLASMGANYSRSDQYQQWGANISGAVVLHSGGVTLGQTVGDTFAIVEAKGAEGASVRNSWGTFVDGNGYALMSNLLPYRENSIGLEAGDMGDNVELLNTQQQVVPVAGAAVRLKYKTRKGIPVLFISKLASGEPVPMGSDVLGSEGEVLGVVGQAGLAYVRLSELSGSLVFRWGGVNQQCQLNYSLEEQSLHNLLRIPAVCE